MAFNQEQQFKELIKQAENILITFKKNYSGDALASALALALFLKNLNKKCTLAADDFKLKQELAFLPGGETVLRELKNLCHFLIEVDLLNKKLSEFSYAVKDHKLLIYVLPEAGQLTAADLKSSQTDYRFDLIITLDTPDLNSLAGIYDQDPDFFFKTTIINIDHNLTNENYGQLNLINPNSSSVAEIIFLLLQNWDKNFLTPEIATLLLAGIIHKTKSFRQVNLTPETLLNTSELINLGADKEKIINNFYQTKNLNTMKLWGRVLVRMQIDKQLKLAWSVVPISDFIKTSTSEDQLEGLAEEMILNSAQIKIFLLIYETPENLIKGQLFVAEADKKASDAKWLLNNLEISGTREKVFFTIKNKTLTETEMELIAELRNKITNNN